MTHYKLVYKLRMAKVEKNSLEELDLSIQQQKQNNIICLTSEQLTEDLIKFYQSLVDNQLPSLSTTISLEFDRIQRQIISVVQIRKNMQKMIELNSSYQQQFNIVHQLLEQRICNQRLVANLSKKIVQRQVELSEKSRNRILNYHQNVKRLAQEVDQLKNGIYFDKYSHLKNQIQQLKQSQIQQHIEFFPIANHQLNFVSFDNQRFQMKTIYSLKHKQLLLRQQLFEQRQKIIEKYSQSNCDLIEELLKAKQRDYNLHNRERQRYAERQKNRHQIDLENQINSESHRKLTELYQIQIIKLKNQLKIKSDLHLQQTEQLEAEINRINLINLQISEQLKEAHNKFEAVESQNRSLTQKKYQLQNSIAKLTIELNNYQKKYSDYQEITSDRIHLIQKGKELELDHANLLKKIQSLEAQFQAELNKNRQLILKNQHLSKSYHNIAYQKASLTTNHLQLLNQIEKQKQEINILKQKNYDLIQKNVRDGQEHQNMKDHLEKEMTETFIFYNSKKSQLQRDLTLSRQQIANLKEQITEYKSKIIDLGDRIGQDEVEELKQSILKEIKNGEAQRQSLFNQFVVKMQRLYL